MAKPITESVTLALVGDVMLGRGVNQEIAHRSAKDATGAWAESFWGDVLPLLRTADGAIANLECAVTTHLQKCRRTPKVFYFRADPIAVQVLSAARICCVSLANNHSLDFDDRGLLDTLDSLRAAGIVPVGAGRTLHDAIAPVVLSIGGIPIGIIALTDNEPSFIASRKHPGVNYLKISEDPDTLGQIQTAVAQVRQAGASLVILSAHWGPNMVLHPPPHFQAFAHAVVDWGVDLFYGHSAHLFQGVEIYHGRLILYDTGDFLDDYAVDPNLRNDWSFLFLVQLDRQGVQGLKLIPVRLTYAQVDRARGAEFDAICQRMQRLSAQFGTVFSEVPDGLEVWIRPKTLKMS